MQVKTFEATTVKDAIRAVKAEFGSDAVILNSRRLPIPGGNGQQMFEVTAAASRSRQSGASAHDPAIDAASQDDLRQKLQSVDMRLSVMNDELPTKANMENIENSLEELRMLIQETIRAKDGAVIEDVPEDMVAIERQLRLTGITAGQIATLIKFLKDLPPRDGEKLSTESMTDYYRSQAIRWMLKRVQIAPRWQTTPGSMAIHAFMGPTGAGKTSIVAKIASQYHLKEKAKVLVISHDHTRMAGSEQLRVYCKIIGAPFETIADLAELKDVVAKHRDAELVLIDTAGRSPKSAASIKELHPLNTSELAVDKHLVLSITEKESQMERSVRQFSPVGINSLIFSKLDESWSYGEIFNVATKWSLPISHFSIGQRIPEDIERASRERIVERIFGV